MVARNGFTPLGTPDTRYVNNYPVSAGTRALCKGDACRYTAGRITAIEAGMDPGPVFGIVMDVFTTANRPLTFQNNKCIVSGGVGRADVCWDPDQIYYVKCETSLGVGDVPVNAMVDISAFSTVLGISGQAIAVQTSASVGNPFKIISVGPFDELGGKGTGGVTANGAMVVINNHLTKAGT